MDIIVNFEYGWSIRFQYSINLPPEFQHLLWVGTSVVLETHTEVFRVNDPNLLLILQLMYVCSNG